MSIIELAELVNYLHERIAERRGLARGQDLNGDWELSRYYNCEADTFETVLKFVTERD